jgi:hypothetical protein
MTTPSTVPAAIDALVTLFTAAVPANSTVVDGPAVIDPGAFKNIVYVGVDDPDTEGPYTIAATAQQAWAWLGHVQRAEDADVHCSVICWNGDADQKAARDGAYALLTIITDAITADPTLGGAVLYVVGVNSDSLMQSQDTAGAEAKLNFSVSIKSQFN